MYFSDICNAWNNILTPLLTPTRYISRYSASLLKPVGGLSKYTFIDKTTGLDNAHKTDVSVLDMRRE